MLNEQKFKNTKDFQKYFNRNLLSVSMTGPFNSGKTFLANKLSGGNQPSNDTYHTKGISLYMNED